MVVFTALFVPYGQNYITTYIGCSAEIHNGTSTLHIIGNYTIQFALTARSAMRL